MSFAETHLVKLSLTGDRSAFGQLVELYKGKIHRLAYRMLNNPHDSEDVVQETFMRVYLNLNRYDEKQKFSTWIYRIGKNLCVDLLRKKKSVYSLDAEIAGEDEMNHYGLLSSEEQSPEMALMETELHEQLNQVIDKLSDKYKAIASLYYVHDLSIQEISEKLDIPVTTVKTRLYRGREYLRKRWGMSLLISLLTFFNFIIL
jgi:RNA polymerase sigma-70 factor (ECF subfamily)